MINVLTHMSDIMIPMVIFWIVGYGMVSGVKVYETFLKGAKEGLRFMRPIIVMNESGEYTCQIDRIYSDAGEDIFR